MSVSLYRKYRPQNFASVVGQKPAIDVLTSSLAKKRVGHAYLFSGSRGCGKTSVARIFAKALNCLDPQGVEPCGKCRNCEAVTAGESLDVIEIDGASNNGVDEVRQLKENITLTPFSSKYKIYIIDEVHMLSTAAFNALLKTLEEPPEYVVFIMATTEPRKVPVTIRSRCQHIPFHSITAEDIFARLKFVCDSEGVSTEDEALYEVARQADGALRDALSLLEQVIASGNITLQNVEAVFGAGSRPAFERWVRTLREDKEAAYLALKSMFDAGASGVRVFEEMFSLVRNLWLASNWKSITGNLGLSKSEQHFIAEEAPQWTPGKLHSLLNNILRAMTQARQGVRSDILLGTFMLSLEAHSPPEQLLSVPPASPAIEQEPGLEVKFAVNTLEIRYDPKLKADLMEIASKSDFALYCAMFDINAGLRGKELVLKAGHIFTFETLRAARRASDVQAVFGNYGQVILKFGDLWEVKCPERVKEEALPVQKVHKPEAVPEFLPQSNSDATDTPQADDKPEPQGHKSSIFDKYRQELAVLGAQPEVLMIKYKEPEESSDEDDTSTELEGDNDE
ncbi:MAG: DNA polymerase III subunit gamma/tau [Synergistaceae bacterium]|nr:DNA polymerase III subunit gamma/tau [Synergistaceae bacterium]